MSVIKLILTIIFVIACIVLTVIVLMQEGKSAGLGAISGAAETYWGKNKGRSMEGTLEKLTRVLVIAFIVIAIVLIPISKKVDSSAATDTTTDDNNITLETDDTNIDLDKLMSESSGEASDAEEDTDASTEENTDESTEQDTDGASEEDTESAE